MASAATQIAALSASYTHMVAVNAIRYDDDEAWQRTYAIERHGQPVRLRVEWSGHLIMVEREPLDGVAHLVQTRGAMRPIV